MSLAAGLLATRLDFDCALLHTLAVQNGYQTPQSYIDANLWLTGGALSRDVAMKANDAPAAPAAPDGMKL